MRLMKHYTWRVGGIRYHVAAGDIFHAPVDAIVNSEQTDFILSYDPESISGQIRERAGEQVQKELDAQTRR